MKNLEECEPGQCVYCNHCLPCPSSIDIGQVTRLSDVARVDLTEDAKAEYHGLDVRASECTKCGACVSRCPFEVDTISSMERAASLFQWNRFAICMNTGVCYSVHDSDLNENSTGLMRKGQILKVGVC